MPKKELLDMALGEKPQQSLLHSSRFIKAAHERSNGDASNGVNGMSYAELLARATGHMRQIRQEKLSASETDSAAIGRLGGTDTIARLLEQWKKDGRFKAI